MREDFKKVTHESTLDFMVDDIDADIFKLSSKYIDEKVTHKIGLAYGETVIWTVIGYTVPSIKF